MDLNQLIVRVILMIVMMTVSDECNDNSDDSDDDTCDPCEIIRDRIPDFSIISFSPMVSLICERSRIPFGIFSSK